MKNIFLGTKKLEIIESIKSEGYEVNSFDRILLSDEKTLYFSIFIFDAIFYKNISDEIRKKLPKISTILLFDKNEDFSFIKNFKLTYKNIFILHEDKTDCVNLISLIDCHFSNITSNNRLNCYIKDSFQNIIDTNLLEKQKREIEELNMKLQEISKVDHLTNLLNRRALMEAFENEKKRALRHRWRIEKNHVAAVKEWENEANKYISDTKGGIQEHIGNFSCIMADIDHFKKINDTYGHLTGDMVLKRFGEILRTKGLFRENDIFGRFGGEEFIILLPETNSKNAYIPAERLREAIKKIDFRDESGNNFKVTLSLGVAEFLPDEVSTDDLINRADMALYYAKKHGRDQVCIYSEALLSETI